MLGTKKSSGGSNASSGGSAATTTRVQIHVPNVKQADPTVYGPGQVFGEQVWLARFAEGVPTSIVDMNSSQSGASSPSSSSVEFSLYQPRSQRQERKILRVLRGAAPHVEYVGKNFAEQSARNNLSKYAVGVFDPTTSQLRVLPVSHVYQLQQHVRTSVLIDPESEMGQSSAATNAVANQADYAMRNKRLVDTFGSKKRKSQVASRESNKVIMQNEIETVLKHTMETSDVHDIETEESIIKQTKQALLPNFNDQTNVVAEIYPIENLLPFEDWGSLRAHAETLIGLAQNPTNDDPDMSLFVLDRLAKIHVVDDTREARVRRATLLAYAQLLIQFSTSYRKGSPSKWCRDHGVPNALMNRLMTDFFSLVESGSRSTHNQSSELRRKLRCYLCILCLIIGDYSLGESDLENLSQDLKSTVNDLLLVFREVGCTVCHKKQVQLTAPLSLPTFRKRRKQG